MAVQAAMALVHDRMPVLLFQLAGSKDSIVTSGRIAWKSDSGTFAGVQFVDMLEPMRDLIKSWLAEENSSRAPREPEECISAVKKFLAGFDFFPAETPSNTLAAPDRSAGPAPEKIISQPFFQKTSVSSRRGFRPCAASSAARGKPLVVARSANHPQIVDGPSVDILPATYIPHRRKGHNALLIAVVAALSGILGWAIGRGFPEPRSLQHCAFRHRKNDSSGREAPAVVSNDGSPPASVRQVPQVATSTRGTGMDFYWAHNARKKPGRQILRRTLGPCRGPSRKEIRSRSAMTFGCAAIPPL